MVVEYPPEPVLSEAACQLLHDGISSGMVIPDRLSTLLEFFFNKVLCGLVDVGEIGELIARMIFSLSYDDAKLSDLHKNSGPFPHLRLFSLPIYIETFLESLIEENYAVSYENVFLKDPRKVPAQFKKALVSFTTWIRLGPFSAQRTLSQEWLAELYHKRTAVMFHYNQAGTDFLIPLRLADGTYSFLLVQVKNRFAVSPGALFKYSGDKLTPLNCFNFAWNGPYLAIYVEVGAETSKLENLNPDLVTEHVERYPGHILLLGFQSMKISAKDPLNSVFRFACRRQVEFRDESNRKEILSKMIPLKYKWYPAIAFCRCKTGCQDFRCGCRKREVGCSTMCKCDAGGCQNPVIPAKRKAVEESVDVDVSDEGL